jgi:predicted phage tail component-like protein
MTTTDLELNASPLSVAVPEVIILAVRRPLVGARRHVSIDVPGRAGSWTYSEEPGDRTISVDFNIAADTLDDRRAAVRSLADWLDVGATSRLYIDDEPDRFHTAILDAAPEAAEWLLGAGGSVAFRVGPYAEAATLSVENLAAPADPTSGSFNTTDDVAAPPIIEIQAGGGNVTAFAFTLNGDTIARTADAPALGNGQTLTISTISNTVSTGVNGDAELVGAYDPALVQMADVSGQFPYVVGGPNPWSITWDGTATSIAITVTWRTRYR